MSDRLLTIKEAADYLKVHWQTVRGLLKAGKLPYTKIGRNIRIQESELQSLITKGKHSNKYEMEIRFLTEKRKIIEERLIKMDAKIIHHSRVIDHWFVPTTIKNIAEKNTWFDTGKGYGLRISEEDNGYTGKIATSLEIKRLVTPHHHEACIEQEIDVENYKEALSLLSLMDMKEFATLDKDRVVYELHRGRAAKYLTDSSTYARLSPLQSRRGILEHNKLKEFKVVIDDIKNFKTGVEIELMTDKKRDEVLPEMREIAQSLGLDIDKEMTDKSVTYLYMTRFAKF